MSNKTTIRIEGSGATWKLTSKSGTVTASQQGSLWHMVVVARENFSTWPENKRTGMVPYRALKFGVAVIKPYTKKMYFPYSGWGRMILRDLPKPRLP